MAVLRQPLLIDDELVELISSFIYLSYLLNWQRDHNKAIGRRLVVDWTTFRKNKSFFTTPRSYMGLERRLFHYRALPAMLYGCDTWALTKAVEDRLAKAQRYMVRQMVSVRLRNRWTFTRLCGVIKLNDIVESAHRRKWRVAVKGGSDGRDALDLCAHPLDLGR